VALLEVEREHEEQARRGEVHRQHDAEAGAEPALLEQPQARCDTTYPGTREGLILVLETPLSDDTLRRQELADFLKTRRDALQPEDVGLPGGGRRRTPGLRREEVALLAGVGTTWYTWLEQARDVRASREVLDALATALHLGDAEREHLVHLGRGSGARPAAPVETVAPAVRRLVESLEGTLAYVLGCRWDYLAWNDALSAVFGDPGEMPEGRRNHLWRLFTTPGPRQLSPNWEKSARLAVARFRNDYAPHLGDPWFEELIADLQETSPEFRAWWKEHKVKGHSDGRKCIVHPVEGQMKFEHASFRHNESAEQRLVLYSPVEADDTLAKVDRLVAAWRAGQR
jgi:transcriptional regulator with XRE-family HTH domain